MGRTVKRKNTLNDVVNQATQEGMTYGKYQTREILMANRDDVHEKLQSHKPVYVKITGEYLCPACGTRLEIKKNCQECRQVIVWRAGMIK